MFRAALVCLALAAPLRAEPPTVADLVRQLGHDRFAVREAAHAELLRRGESVVPELDKAARGADPETAARVRKIRTALVGYLEDIERLLADVDNRPDHYPEPIRDELRVLIEGYQPRTGEFLLSFIADAQHPLHRRAVRAFLQTWPTMSAAHLEAFVRHRVFLTTKHRPKFPAKAGGLVPMGAYIRDGWAGWFETQASPEPFMAAADRAPPRLFRMTCRTTRYLDGKPYDKPYVHQHPFGTVGSYRTGESTEGKHTIHAVLEYEFTHKGEKRSGSIRSPDSTFDVVSADTPDDLAAPKSEALTKAVRTAFRLQETGFHKAAETDWSPQITWAVGGKQAGVHCPVWGMRYALDVDVCFAVEIHDLTTGKVHPADPLMACRGETHLGYIAPRDARAFAADCDGFVRVKIVLTPSRGLALSHTWVTRYYPEGIETAELRMKVYKNWEPVRP